MTSLNNENKSNFSRARCQPFLKRFSTNEKVLSYTVKRKKQREKNAAESDDHNTTPVTCM